jgi:CBASS immunity sensor of nucleotide second messenger signals/HNH endonuclease
LGVLEAQKIIKTATLLPMSQLQQKSHPAKIRRRRADDARRGAADVTRHISPSVACELWGRAAGRCECCNRLLYKSPLTQERVNISEKAHIYSFSAKGPRGRGPYAGKIAGLNNVENLMLVCHDCHKTIDQDQKGERYHPELLKKWKKAHEARVILVTEISPSNKSHVVLFGAKIGEEASPLQFERAAEALFPNRFPAENRPVRLSMVCEHEDNSEKYWSVETDNLRAAFERHVIPRRQEAEPFHFSVFALAPQPLLILLGSLFTDKTPVDVYQLHREPPTWQWGPHPSSFEFRIKQPQRTGGNPALIISLSASVAHDRVTHATGKNVSIWELTIDEPHNDFLKSEAQLAAFRASARQVIAAIASAHGQASLKIFPAMPVSCAVELGRIRMPKSDMPWEIFDQNNKWNGFVPALTIGEQ